MSNSSAMARELRAEAFRGNFGLSPGVKAVRRNSLPLMWSSNCWCSTMSKPRSARNAVMARTIPGRSGHARVRTYCAVPVLRTLVPRRLPPSRYRWGGPRGLWSWSTPGSLRGLGVSWRSGAGAVVRTALAAFMFGHQVEMDAAVLVHAGRGWPARRRLWRACAAGPADPGAGPGQGNAHQQHDQHKGQGGDDGDALQPGQRFGRFVAAGQQHHRCNCAGQQAPEDDQAAAGFVGAVGAERCHDDGGRVGTGDEEDGHQDHGQDDDRSGGPGGQAAGS